MTTTKLPLDFLTDDSQNENLHIQYASMLDKEDIRLLRLRESAGRGNWSDVVPIVTHADAVRIERIRAYENQHNVDLLNYVPQNL